MCLQLGIDDPEAWLETVPAKTLALWSAFYRVEPWGNDYEQMAVQSSLITMQTAMIAATNGAEFNPRDVADFMPANWADRKPKNRGVVDRESIKQSRKQLEAMYG